MGSYEITVVTEVEASMIIATQIKVLLLELHYSLEGNIKYSATSRQTFWTLVTSSGCVAFTTYDQAINYNWIVMA